MVLKLQHAPESAGAPESPVKTHCWAHPQFSDVGDPWGSRSRACPVSVLDADAVAWKRTVRTAALEPAGEGQCLSRSHIPLVRFPPVMHLFFKMHGTNQVVTLVLLTYLLSSIITIDSLVLPYQHLCSSFIGSMYFRFFLICLHIGGSNYVSPHYRLGPVLVCIPQSPVGLLHSVLYSLPTHGLNPNSPCFSPQCALCIC